MKIIKYITILFIVALFAASGCTEKLSINEYVAMENSTSYSIGDTDYVEIYPPYEIGLNGPTALLYGHDELFYIADTKNNRVIMMDAAGGYLGERTIGSPTALGQDYKLDLLVGGTVAKNGSQIGAIFRIHLVDALHDLATAKIDTVRLESAHPKRRFVGIAVLTGNTYLAARTGTENASSIDPDTRVMEFDTSDKYVTPITDLTTGTGTGIGYINQLTCITPVPSSWNFIVLQKLTGVAYGAIYMKYSSSSDFEGWTPVFNPSTSSTDIIKPNQFASPSGCAIDSKTFSIFITDAAKDSLFKFSSKDGSFKKESFGKFATNGRMITPTGIAFYDKTLYIADSTANCIFRFKLSTDF
jgi:hypothetical protein